MARFASQAEYYRHHRRCFEHARAHGITPRMAEIEFQRDAAQAKHKAVLTQFERDRAQRVAPAPDAGADAEPREQPWMMRD